VGIVVHEKDAVSAPAVHSNIGTRRSIVQFGRPPRLEPLNMAISKGVTIAILSLVSQVVTGQNNTDNLKYVNQLIGSANGGR
jgi:hypothetical protein